MHKIGRNDLCHCGSGKKYKRCCLEKDESNNVTRITYDQKTGLEKMIRLVENELAWGHYLYKLIAQHLLRGMADHYDWDQVEQALRIWHLFSTEEEPITQKLGVYAAAVEYYMTRSFERTSITQGMLALKYKVSEGTISKRYNEINDFMIYWEELNADEPPAGQHPSISPPIRMEKELNLIGQLLEGKNFETFDEVQAFLNEELNRDAAPLKSRNTTPKEQAQNLLYDAFEEPLISKRNQLAQKALALYPDSPDVYNILAENVFASDIKQAQLYYKQGLEAGERELGKVFIKENKGHFWGLTSTRPYMRAKYSYAETCWQLEEKEEALKHYKELLVLNPGDNQGVRYSLLVAYLDTEQFQQAAKLVRTYEDESSAMFNYSRLLLEYHLKGEDAALKPLFDTALRQNRHVWDFLTGKKRVPTVRPEFIGYGDKDEAVEYVMDHLHLWKMVPKLVQMLTLSKTVR